MIDFEPDAETATATIDFEPDAPTIDFEPEDGPSAAPEPQGDILAGTEEFFASGGQPESTLAHFIKPAESLRPSSAALGGEGLPVNNPEAYHTPLVHIPTPEVTGPATGALRGAANLAEGLTSPMNLALLPLLGGAPGIVKTGAGLGFGVPMAKHAISETLPAALDATTPGEATQKLVEGVGELGLATAIVTHKPRVPAVDAAKAAAEAATKVPEAPVAETPVQAKSLESLGVKSETKPVTPTVDTEIIAETKAPIEPVQVVAERQQAIPKGLRSDPELVRLLEGEPVGPQMKAPAVSEEGGFIFGKPTPKVVPKGATPKGDSEFLRIPTALKRVFHGLEREGAADVIGRTKNKVGQVLSKAIKRHVDTEQELFGQLYSKFEVALKGISSGKQEKAFDELQQFFADKENGRPVPAISREAQKILKAWETIADETGTIATAHNVQVFDPKLGGHRPMHKIGKDYFPRVFRPEVQRVMRDPQTNPGLWNALVDSVATHKGIAPDEAANYLRSEAGRFQANDFMGNLEMARSEQLPEIFYDYDLRQVAARYIPSFSDRMSQIIAYGQRLGPRDAPQRQNLWDIARGEAENDYTQKWIRSAEDQAVNLHPNSASARVAVRAQTLANALLLSNPVTTVPRNFISGIAATSEVLGVARSVKPFAKLVTSAQSRIDAREIGAVRDRMADFLHADQLGESFIDDAVRVVTSKALKYSGYNGSEVFVRSHGSLTAQQFAHDAVAAINKNPASRQSREALALFQRTGVDAKQLVAEKADWKTGEETRKFIRTVIRDTQGGYRFDQVPLWANSPVGRFFYQFGRYGTQRSRNIWKNAIKPALGEEVEWNGKTMSVYNPKPLLKMGVGAIAAGEVFAGIAALAFDKDRKDASIKEIRETLAEDTKAGIGLALERALNDVIMAGTLGIWSQPIDFAKQLKDQSRFKNPAEPPSLASVRALIDLTTNAMDQGGKLTTNDMIRFGGSFAPGVKQVTDVARNVFDEPLYEAQNDVRTLRTAGMRWAKTAGLDAAKMAGKFRKSGNAPVYESVQEALLVGNADAARLKAREFLVEQKTREAKEKAMKSLRSSVNSRQPFRVGPYTSDEHRTDFMRWAQQHLPEADYLQAKRIQERYERAAREAGLMN